MTHGSPTRDEAYRNNLITRCHKERDGTRFLLIEICVMLWKIAQILERKYAKNQ